MSKLGFKKGRFEGISGSPFSLKPKALSLFLFIFCLLSANTVLAANVALSWVAPTTNNDNTPLTDLAGFKVYYRTASSYNYQSIDLPNTNTTTYALNNLTDGVTYYFTVTAYNTAGDESNYSNEQCFNSTISCSSSSGGGNGGGDTQTTLNNSGGTSIGGGGCGFIKDINGKGQRAKGELLSIAMLLLLLFHLKLRKIFSIKHLFTPIMYGVK